MVARAGGDQAGCRADVDIGSSSAAYLDRAAQRPCGLDLKDDVEIVEISA